MKQWYILTKEELLLLGINGIETSHIIYSNKPSIFLYYIKFVNGTENILYSLKEIDDYITNLQIDIRKNKIQELL